MGPPLHGSDFQFTGSVQSGAAVGQQKVLEKSCSIFSSFRLWTRGFARVTRSMHSVFTGRTVHDLGSSHDTAAESLLIWIEV